MSLTAALADEQVRVRRLENLESRARAVKRDLVLLKHAHVEMMKLRNELVVLLHEQYGWTDQAAATYFGLSSRQRAHQIRQETP